MSWRRYTSDLRSLPFDGDGLETSSAGSGEQRVERQPLTLPVLIFTF